MDRTKTQREARYFLMALVIKPHQNNNNKKHRNIFGEGQGPINFFFFFWGGGGGGVLGEPVLLFFFFFNSLKKLFEEMGGPWP
jgi:hypothetical protein